jgi:hypothetical protein
MRGIAHLLASAGDDKFQNKVVFTNSEEVVPVLRGRVVLIRGSDLDQLSPGNNKLFPDPSSRMCAPGDPVTGGLDTAAGRLPPA